LALQLSQVAISFYLSGEYDAAVEAGRRAIRAYPDFPQTYRWHAAALGQLGWTAEATEALQKAITIAPALFEMHVHARPQFMRPEDHAHWLEGLRKAGWDG
jgi:adenylate cyclase